MTREQHEIVDWIIGKIEEARTALERGEEGAAEHRGSIRAFRAVIAQIEKPERLAATRTPTAVYGFGQADGLPYT